MDDNKEYLLQKSAEAAQVLESRGIVPIFRTLSFGTRGVEEASNNLRKV